MFSERVSPGREAQENEPGYWAIMLTDPKELRRSKMVKIGPIKTEDLSSRLVALQI